uniref:Large neutral amino acids transporter small subunit 2-like n=1 Tax=Monodelphis domestica TaxID=13616 RepID=A0A5F8G3N7_MONDO
MGQLCKCSVGHPSAGHLHGWKALGPGPDYCHGGCPDLQRTLLLAGAQTCI